MLALVNLCVVLKVLKQNELIPAHAPALEGLRIENLKDFIYKRHKELLPPLSNKGQEVKLERQWCVNVRNISSHVISRYI